MFIIINVNNNILLYIDYIILFDQIVQPYKQAQRAWSIFVLHFKF